MQSVYEPASSVQAHILQDVLRQQGIASHVQGEHLQGAIGELPAGTLLRLLVDDADYAAARRVLDDWEQAPPMDEDELASFDRSEPAPATPAYAAAPRAHRWHPLWWAAGGAACVLALQLCLSDRPLQSSRTDKNGNGAADAFSTENGTGEALLLKRDRNPDNNRDADHGGNHSGNYSDNGRLDSGQAFDTSGLLKREAPPTWVP